MKFDYLTDHEKKVVLECVHAVINGPFIPEQLFHTLMGIERSDYIRFIDDWEGDSLKNEDEANYIYCALLQLIEYPHNKDDVWFDYISEPKENVSKIFYKFSGVDSPLPKRWDGIIKGYFTPNAQKRWDRISEIKQKHILTNVWCPHCSEITTISEYEGSIDNLNRISIYGKCIKCFKPIETIIQENTGGTSGTLQE